LLSNGNVPRKNHRLGLLSVNGYVYWCKPFRYKSWYCPCWRLRFPKDLRIQNNIGVVCLKFSSNCFVSCCKRSAGKSPCIYFIDNGFWTCLMIFKSKGKRVSFIFVKSNDEKELLSHSQPLQRQG
jgi:hypothetical protein